MSSLDTAWAPRRNDLKVFARTSRFFPSHGVHWRRRVPQQSVHGSQRRNCGSVLLFQGDELCRSSGDTSRVGGMVKPMVCILSLGKASEAGYLDSNASSARHGDTSSTRGRGKTIARRSARNHKWVTVQAGKRQFATRARRRAKDKPAFTSGMHP
jgi:hypothetical protein